MTSKKVVLNRQRQQRLNCGIKIIFTCMARWKDFFTALVW